MIDFSTPSIYERVINEKDNIQVRLVINTFRGVEYLSLRKYYLDFEEEWLPSKEGISIPLDLDNTQELFTGLVEILSLAESKSIIEDEFKEILDEIYQT
jgi:TPP-dependent indolepyruvate ferredoxin oxidoreductase alpha subunit|tara:strand:+ start:53 stop:349 length:297 start_codon:yes stop_codon:yes gene_type:complete